MNNNKIPRTPFSTPLSGSAKETELRLKNIFSGPKKRPPIPFLALVFALCIFCGDLVSCRMAQDAPPPDSPRQDAPAVRDSAVSRLERRSGAYTFLLIAGAGDGAPADAFMALCYDTQRQTAGLVAIPRDTLIDQEGEAVRLGSGRNSREQQIAGVSRMLGIPIDYYIDVDAQGFAALVDELGGIDFYVPCDMDYEDPAQGLSIHFKEGQAHLSGQQAMEVARYRKDNSGGGYPAGDLDRVQTQRQLMEALAKKLLSWDSAAKLDAFVDLFGQSVETDLSVSDMVYFAGKAVGLDLSGGLETATLPLQDPAADGSLILGSEPDPEPALEVVDRLLSPYTEPMALEDMDLVRLDR